MWIPKRPESLEEAKLDAYYVEDSILKILASKGATRGGGFADILKLPFSLIEPIIREMREKDLIAPSGGSGIGGNGGLDFGLTPKGIELAATVNNRSTYFGPSPVDIQIYTTSVQSQKFLFNCVRKQHLDTAFSDIMISADYLSQLGPAINSGGHRFFSMETRKRKDDDVRAYRPAFQAGDVRSVCGPGGWRNHPGLRRKNPSPDSHGSLARQPPFERRCESD